MSGMRHLVAWLPAVRWSACLVLWAAVAVLTLLPQLDLSLRGLETLVTCAAISRTLLAITGRGAPAPRAVMGLACAVDAALLTGLLDVTGGPFNPFIVMYATYVWTAFVAGSVVWALITAAVSAAGFFLVVADHIGLDAIEHHRLNDLPTHLLAIGFSGAGVAELVAHYVARARAHLADRQARLDEAREKAARSERLAALTTLAAGAAHELSTPLATIAVAARELERHSARVVHPPDVAEALCADARLIRAELERCQAILDGMSGRAASGSTSLDPLSPHALADLVRARLPETRRRRLDVEISPDTRPPAAPGIELARAILSLVDNAFDASGDDQRVQLRFLARSATTRIEIRDQGCGMTDEVRRQAGNPFFTTKPPGKGLGLGLFLVRTFVERAGGSLEFVVGGGTTAIVEMPALPAASPVER